MVHLTRFILPVLLAGQLGAQITAGPNNPGTITTGACSFSYSSALAYTPSGNVAVSDNAVASVSHCNCCDANTNCLTPTNFGFAIPGAATVQGITVEIEKRASFLSNVQDNGLRLLKAGVEVGANKKSAASWPSFDLYTAYGGPADLWGTTWTPAEINAANFGLVFASIDYSCGFGITSHIDHVRITVTYDFVLPVSEIQFAATCDQGQPLLSWETTTETNTSHFEIQRFINGREWLPVGTVPANGTSNQPIGYTFTDDSRSPTGEAVYYRLKQVDVNGEEQLYDRVALTCRSQQAHPKFLSTATPNTFRIIGSQDAKLSLFNMVGQPIELQPYSTESSEYLLDLNNLPLGAYVLKVAQKGNSYGFKVLVH